MMKACKAANMCHHDHDDRDDGDDGGSDVDVDNHDDKSILTGANSRGDKISQGQSGKPCHCCRFYPCWSGGAAGDEDYDDDDAGDVDEDDYDDDNDIHPRLHAQLKTSLWLFFQLGELRLKFTSSSSSSSMRFPLQSSR